MIGTFAKMQELRQEGQNVSDLGGSIGLALFATALGLTIAIPLVFSHVLFKAWIANFEVRMKSAAQKLMVLMQAARPGVNGPPASPNKAADTAVIRR
jgi:biopolymer transport protein ExbB